ncbi:hypothetical protein Vadar_022535 [Vaccinium darrowii]|uniref:Uncharacterized protein n=1 Tax=Vaccinium darrowii TaxID=229202 RepID=A0ACB7XT30_9ERIC|nr:hypothetical protein Vadar_022535 [Vaccinium darrowii]
MRSSLGAVIGRYPSSDGNAQMGGIIKHNRKCRDVVFLVIFIAFWIGMIVNSSFGFNRGNPLRLTYGLDYKGNVCGDRHANPNLRELELRYWLNPNQVYQSGLKNSQFKLDNARSICLLDCPIPSEDSLDWVCDYPEGDIRLSVEDWIDRNYDYFADLTPVLRNTSLQLQGPCYPVIFPSVNVYWSCQFIARASNVSLRRWQQMGGVSVVEDILIDKSIHKSINSQSAILKRYVADVGKSWQVLLVCGGILPLFLSVIWLLMIRHFVAGMPWITVILFNVLIISFTMFYYLKAGWIGNSAISPIIGEHDPYYNVSFGELKHLQAVAVLMTIVMIISVLSSIAIVRRILMATSVLKVAAKVIGEVQALIIFPVIPYFILAIFYMFWLSAALHLFSSGQILENDCDSNCCAYELGLKKVSCDRCCGYSIHYTSHIGAAILFHLFGCYWATQFFIACSSTVIAGSVASYYWARGETSPEIPFLPVVSSMKRLMRYSLGSVALGCLIVSFVESIRFILEAIRRRLKVVNVVPESHIGRAVYYSSQFFRRCIEWTIKSVNRNAYIMIAITGKSFFKASQIATELIISNILRIGKVNVIGDVILFLGKLCVSLSSAVFAFLMLNAHKYNSAHNKITSPLFPVLVCWGLGYVVATLFFGVVEMSIDTIILSFCQDSDEHQGLSSAHRLLLDSIDDNKPRESPSNMAEGGNGGGVGLTGMEGLGAGFGYGSGHGSGNGGGSGWGVGFGGGKGFGMTPYPGFGQPFYGAEPWPPLDSCTCPCPCNQGGGWARLYSPSKSPAHLEPEITGSMGMPSGWSNMGAHNEPITSNDAKDRHEAHQAPSRYGPFEVAPNNGEPTPLDGSAQASGGSNTGAHNKPITSNDAKDRHEARQAPSSYGPFEVAPNNGEPTPPDRSAQEVPMNDGEPSPPDGSARKRRNEMVDPKVMNGNHLVVDNPRP